MDLNFVATFGFGVAVVKAFAEAGGGAGDPVVRTTAVGGDHAHHTGGRRHRCDENESEQKSPHSQKWMLG